MTSTLKALFGGLFYDLDIHMPLPGIAVYNEHMPTFRDRTCTQCGDVEYNTATHSDICLKCFVENKRNLAIENEQNYLETLGYLDVKGPTLNQHGQRMWQFVHECGTEQIWTFGNILKRRKADPNTVPCSSCGGKRRTKNATKVSADNNKIKNPVGWIEYKMVVRRLTANTYAVFKDEINPLNLPRGMHDHHLDHILSIAEGWEQGLAPEFLARKENLQMLTAKDNLSKGRK